MNIKAALLLPAAIAMLITSLPMTPALAQTQSPSATPSQGKPARPNKLNLTDAEKAQMQQAMQRMRDRVMNEVLTDAQRQQVQAAKQTVQSGQATNGRRDWQGMRQMFKSLNLTDAQKQQIRTIREEEFSKLPADLRQKLDSRRANMQQRRSSGQQRRQNQPNTTPSNL
ncbi:hypothetical protein [Pantanalinema sp. GBBB05]|uniref:hypothetical protein n=1 Tax=Pantanalinema sp. GBBB05 TaxID=2604139 RepID=UPI001DC93040|nr:hypothetical protein [Pantanalinema sp. GBBB05]